MKQRLLLKYARYNNQNEYSVLQITQITFAGHCQQEMLGNQVKVYVGFSLALTHKNKSLSKIRIIVGN